LLGKETPAQLVSRTVRRQDIHLTPKAALPVDTAQAFATAFKTNLRAKTSSATVVNNRSTMLPTARQNDRR